MIYNKLFPGGALLASLYMTSIANAAASYASQTDQEIEKAVMSPAVGIEDTSQSISVEHDNEKSRYLHNAFSEASNRMNVPMDLLLALSWAETRWDNRNGKPSALGGYGMMLLSERADTPNGLSMAAKLTGLDVNLIKRDDWANILGAAAILKALADEAGMSLTEREALESWYPVVIRYCGIKDEYLARDHADQVYLFLRQGVSDKSNSGEDLMITGREIEPVKGRYADLPERYSSAPDPHDFVDSIAFTKGLERGIPFPPYIWNPADSTNFRVANRPYDYVVDRIVIHDMEGYYQSSIDMWKQPNQDSSAHFCVRSSDGEITQMVATKDVAWHAILWNNRSVGIEHEGFCEQPDKWFTDAMYRSSAKLVAAICSKFGIPVDRDHIMGHGEANEHGAGGDHYDPGQYWDWDRYMKYVREASGQIPPGFDVILDNASSSFSASSNWGTSGYTSTKYGSNYRYADPAPVGDAGYFTFNVPKAGNYEISAWWPADPGYNASTPFVIFSSSGKKTINVDQRTNGGKWNVLGTFSFNAGSQQILAVSRWSSSPGYVIADAIRVVAR